MNNKPASAVRLRLRYLIPALLATLVLAIGLWTVWSEREPERERELRIQVREQLEEWFPEQMSLPEDQVGFVPRSAVFDEDRRPEVLLLHGLDEPGGIFDELVAALDEAGFNAWEFRFPNDQALDRSTDLLATHWAGLPADRSVILVGHSMGGLVIRDFVTRWRHPVDGVSRLDGARVGGTILVAPPNHGSDWARLRVWLEVREWLTDIRKQRFSLFAGLRDGTGAAKIDLRPDSAFLVELNERAWPPQVPMKIIGGTLAEPTAAMIDSLGVLSEQVGGGDVTENLARWWEAIGENLGDGVVPLESLALDGQPQPIILEASHRGLLVQGPTDEGEPPAIAPIIDILKQWSETGRED